MEAGQQLGEGLAREGVVRTDEEDLAVRDVVDRAEEHLGERAARYLRKFYPWYLERLEVPRREAAAFQQIDDLDTARAMIAELAAEGGPERGSGDRSQALVRA